MFKTVKNYPTSLANNHHILSSIRDSKEIDFPSERGDWKKIEYFVSTIQY